MAGGIGTDFKIYNDFVQAGKYETVAQAFDKFNANSGGCIILRAAQQKGNYHEEAFYKLAGSVTRRDLTSVADVSDTKLEQGAHASPKISWKYGPFAMTQDAFRKIARDDREFSFVLGQQMGGQLAATMLNSAAAALKGIFYASDAAGAAARHDASGDSTGTATYDKFFKAAAKLGDRGMMIASWLMDGASFYKIGASATSLESVAGVWMTTGEGPILGKKLVITDSPYLRVDANSVANDFSILYGLVPGAVILTESEELVTHGSVVDNKENLMVRWRAEGAFNLEVKGFTWSVADLNPSDATLATKTKWTRAVSSIKDGPGVCLITDGNYN